MADIVQNIVSKSLNYGIIGFSVVSSILSTFMLLTFLFLWFSYGHVYKNVNRRSKVRINVDSSQLITLNNIQDPYTIIKGAVFGSQGDGINYVDSTTGKFYIALPNSSKYDFTKATIHSTLKDGFVTYDTINPVTLEILPYVLTFDDPNYVITHTNGPFDLYLSITWEQPASL